MRLRAVETPAKDATERLRQAFASNAVLRAAIELVRIAGVSLVQHGLRLSLRGKILTVIVSIRRERHPTAGGGCRSGCGVSAQAALKHVFRASTVRCIVADDDALIVVVARVGDRVVPECPTLSGVLGLVCGVGAGAGLYVSAGRW